MTLQDVAKGSTKAGESALGGKSFSLRQRIGIAPLASNGLIPKNPSRTGHYDVGPADLHSKIKSRFSLWAYRRSFRVSKRVDAEKIRAEMRVRVITLVLPKAEEAKPRRIEVA